MKWPWRRRHDEDQAALEDAQRSLEQTRRQWPAVHRATAELDAHRERNHISEKLALIYTGRKP